MGGRQRGRGPTEDRGQEVRREERRKSILLRLTSEDRESRNKSPSLRVSPSPRLRISACSPPEALFGRTAVPSQFLCGFRACVGCTAGPYRPCQPNVCRGFCSSNLRIFATILRSSGSDPPTAQRLTSALWRNLQRRRPPMALSYALFHTRQRQGLGTKSRSSYGCIRLVSGTHVAANSA